MGDRAHIFSDGYCSVFDGDLRLLYIEVDTAARRALLDEDLGERRGIVQHGNQMRIAIAQSPIPLQNFRHV